MTAHRIRPRIRRSRRGERKIEARQAYYLMPMQKTLLPRPSLERAPSPLQARVLSQVCLARLRVYLEAHPHPRIPSLGQILQIEL